MRSIALCLALAACGDSPSSGPDAGTQQPLPDSRDVVMPGDGPLKGLPSPEGPHIAQIQALGNNEWLDLGAPAADPVFGSGRGRSWGGRALMLAPGIRGAFFTGEGRHAYVKPDGRAMDDIFVYDINAHRWIAVYAGTDTTTFNQQVASGDIRIADDGQVVDAAGSPIPIHILIHAWDYLAYDADRDQFAMFAGDPLGRYYLGGETAMEQGLQTLETARATKPNPPMSPWFYDVPSARFQRRAIAAEPPAGYTSYTFFQYLPNRKQYLLAGSFGAAFYDPDAGTWSNVATTGTPPTGYDYGGCYDPSRDRIYLGPGYGGAAGIYVLDLTTSTWSKLAESANAPTNLGTNSASVFCDTVSDVVTVMHYASGTRHVYDPDASSWTKQALPASVMNSNASWNGFFDSELNAYFVYGATDSEDNGKMWAYRLRAQ